MEAERDEVDLEMFRKIGDAEADADLERILASLTEPELREFMPKLGRWEPTPKPGTERVVLAPAVQAYIDRPFSLEPAAAACILAAQQAYDGEHRPGGRVVLGAYSLPLLYLEPEISLTLATTGRMMMHIRSRLEDTQSFLDGVMKPGSLVPGGDGQKWVRKIRLTHAAIRKLVREGGKSADKRAFLESWLPGGAAPLWETRIEGPVEDRVPLDQVELALVLQTFAWVIVDGLEKMGWPMSDDEAENHIQAWSAIGALLGADARLLPAGNPALPAAKALFQLIVDSLMQLGDPIGANASDKKDTWLSGRLLTSALLTVLTQIAREHTPHRYHWLLQTFPRLDEALQQMPRVLIRRLLGKQVSRQLRIPRVGWFDQVVCWLGMKLIDPRSVAQHKPSGPSTPHAIGSLL
tara:strand:- start:841 stop:2064 length:1224 start_codon:yes stop_codon:yes gene_type:complete